MAKSRSGTQWTETEYAAKGYGRISLRLPLDALAILRDASTKSGRSRVELIAEAIRQCLAVPLEKP
jgi:hypothetical protein